MRKLLTAVLSAITILAGSVAFAAPASASVQGYCSSGGMCLYYNSQAYGWGAEYGTTYNTPSFNPSRNGGITYAFIAGSFGSAGAGQTIWNNAGGAGNYGLGFNMQVCQNSNYTGICDYVPYTYQISLGATHNNDTSIRWA